MTDRWRYNAAPTEPDSYRTTPEDRPEPRMSRTEWAAWHRQRAADAAVMVANARRALAEHQAEVEGRAS